MGKKSQPSAPAAPDPMATAQAQTGVARDAAITEANLNRINQVTPQGSLTYTQTGTNPDGTPQYTQTQTYSPDEQRKYDQANQVAIALNDLGVNNIGRVRDVQSQDFNFNSMTPLQTSVGGGLPGINYGAGGSYDPVKGIGDTGNIQRGLDYSGLTALPGTSDFSADAQRVNDAVYGQATSRLDPRFQQSEDDMRARLAAQGISENSDAYRREMDNFNRSKTDAYNQAQFSARQAGADEQSRLFGLALGARQQGQNETNTQGNFANSAQAQQYAQAMGIADLYNQGQGQQYAQDQGQAAFSNEARNQAFNQESANAALNNQGRQQQISEASYLRNLPLNEIASLMSGSSVNNPTFQDYSQVSVQPGNYQGQVQSNYAAANQQYQNKQAARSNALGSIFGLAGTAASMIPWSDRRLKRNVKRVGGLANGLATYTFNYLNDAVQRFGVMAQEALRIVPDAVGRAPNGYLVVDYRKVF